MKLVDILARELRVWPHSGNAIGQASDTTLHLNEHAGHGGEFYGWTKEKFTRAEDHHEAFVTRAQWQAAVDALKAAENAMPEWNGEGLTPVGIDVQMFSGYSHSRFDRFIGQKVHVVAHDVINGDPVAVFRMPIDGDDAEQDYHAMVAGSFRPIRTPKQIAAEDLRRIIESGLNGAKTLTQVIDEILAAGYRKFEIVDN